MSPRGAAFVKPPGRPRLYCRPPHRVRVHEQGKEVENRHSSQRLIRLLRERLTALAHLRVRNNMIPTHDSRRSSKARQTQAISGVMADDKLADAILAQYNAQSDRLRDLLHALKEFQSELTVEEIARWNALSDRFSERQKRLNQTFVTLFAEKCTAKTPQQKMEHTGHALAALEQDSEEARQMANELLSIVRNHLV